jgi:hypothetical protein
VDLKNANNNLIISSFDTSYVDYPQRYNYPVQIPLVANQNKYYLSAKGNDTFLLDKPIMGLRIRFNTDDEANSITNNPLCKLNILQNSFLTCLVNNVQTLLAAPLENYAFKYGEFGQPYAQLRLPSGLSFQQSFIDLNATAVAAIVANSVIELDFLYLAFNPGASNPV